MDIYHQVAQARIEQCLHLMEDDQDPGWALNSWALQLEGEAGEHPVTPHLR